jgi:hypothetical protein
VILKAIYRCFNRPTKYPCLKKYPSTKKTEKLHLSIQNCRINQLQFQSNILMYTSNCTNNDTYSHYFDSTTNHIYVTVIFFFVYYGFETKSNTTLFFFKFRYKLESSVKKTIHFSVSKLTSPDQIERYYSQMTDWIQYEILGFQATKQAAEHSRISFVLYTLGNQYFQIRTFVQRFVFKMKVLSGLWTSVGLN